jgi:hypothetical protein
MCAAGKLAYLNFGFLTLNGVILEKKIILGWVSVETFPTGGMMIRSLLLFQGILYSTAFIPRIFLGWIFSDMAPHRMLLGAWYEIVASVL